MADLLDDMAAHLVASGVTIGGSAVALWNGSTGTIFLARMPDSATEPDAVISLYEENGSAPLETMGRDTVPIIERPRLTALVRGAPSEYIEPRAVATLVWRALAKIGNETVNGTFYQRVAPMNSVAPYEVDSSDRWTFWCNFDVMRAVAA